MLTRGRAESKERAADTTSVCCIDALLFVYRSVERILNFVAAFIFCVCIEKQEIFYLYIEYVLNFAAATTNCCSIFCIDGQLSSRQLADR
jgi:hypothetical protein